MFSLRTRSAIATRLKRLLRGSSSSAGSLKQWKLRRRTMEQLEARRVLAAAILDQSPSEDIAPNVAALIGTAGVPKIDVWFAEGEHDDHDDEDEDGNGDDHGDDDDHEHGGNGGGGTSNGTLLSEVFYSPATPGFARNSNRTKLFADKSDIVKLSVYSDGSWNHEIYFDGSDVGLTTGSENIDALAIRSDGSLLISTTGSANVAGVTANGEDLLLFTPQQLGSSTRGSWQLYVDGSDLGLSSFEGIDGVAELSDGRLLISTNRQATVNGPLNNMPEDLLALTLTSTGAQTVGSWVRYFDGSDVGLAGTPENINGLAVDADGTLHFSTAGVFRVPGMIGDGRDVISFEPTQLGVTTQGSFITPLTLDGSKMGLVCYSIDALDYRSYLSNGQSPVIDPIQPQSVDELVELQLQLSATDADTPTIDLVWSLVSGPIGLSLSSNGLVSWTPTEAQGPGTYQAVVAVSDGTNTTQATINITVGEVNQPPLMAPIGSQSIDEGQELVVQVSASDADLPTQTLSYTLAAGAPAGASIDSNGRFTWTPAESDGPGEFLITVIVTDAYGASATESFTITVREVNEAPQFTNVSNQTIAELAPFTLQLMATDPDLPANALTYGLGGTPPSGLTVSSTGLLAWTPTELQGPGSYPVVVTVSDGVATTEQLLTISVTEVNQPPVLAAMADQQLSTHETLNATAVATDPDLPANVLIYSLLSAPAGATIDPQTGAISWIANQTGDYTFSVAATDEGGLSDSKSFQVTVTGMELRELDQFATTIEQALTVPYANSVLRVTFETPDFDTTAVRDIRDAFEIELTDSAGQTILFPFSSGVDASFNWTEGLAPVAAYGASYTNGGAQGVSTATFNLSSLALGQQIQLKLRLVNNDTDDGSVVRISDVSFMDANAPILGGTSLAANSRGGSVPNVDRLQDITGSLAIDYGTTSLAGVDDRLNTDIIVTNVGSQTITGSLVLVVDSLSDIDVAALQPDGFTGAGKPYFNLPLNQPLQPGQSTTVQRVAFLNASGNRFDVRWQVLAGTNAAPNPFSTTPLASIQQSSTYIYAAQASDPDGQLLNYSIQSGPTGATIDPVSGLLTWPTGAADVGSNHFVIRATDPFGLYVEQSFDVDVVESLQNRPPNFVSDPVTEAIASSGFEITTVATGSSPAGVAVIDGFQGPRLVTIDAGDQRISVLTGQNNDRFDDYTSISTGEPKPTDALFDVGYSVDVGLKPFVTSGDSNNIYGMDQGDFNGDGILDLAVLTLQRLNGLPRDYQVVRLLGDGDGQFSEPLIIGSFTDPGDLNPRNLIVYDTNNDGALDVMFTTSLREPQVHFIAGNGDGTFDAMVSTTYDPDPTDFTDYGVVNFRVGDVDNNGTIDLVGEYGYFVPIGSGHTVQMVWMSGNGDGTFSMPNVIGATDSIGGADQTRAYDIGDLNGDGFLDVVWNTDRTFHIGLNDGAGGFLPTVDIAIANVNNFFRGSAWTRIADFTGDGNPDIAFIHNNSSVLALLVGDGSGANFVMQVGTNYGGRYDSAINDYANNYAGQGDVTDVDGDGDLDIVLSEGFHNNGTVAILRNNGTGEFEYAAYPIMDFPGIGPEGNRYNFGHASGVLAGDYNNDGVIDFSYFTQFETLDEFTGVGIRLGTRPGEFGSTSSQPIRVASLNALQTVYPGDFNGDGITDLIAAGTQASTDILLGLGDGQFSDKIPAINAGGSFYVFGVVDLNHDGLDDVFGRAGNRTFAAVSNGDGTLTQTYSVFGTAYQYNSAGKFGDFNGDGFIDFVGAASVEQTIDVYLNDASSPGNFLRQTGIPTPYGFSKGNTVAAGDFDSDGKADLVINNGDSSGAKSIQILHSNGDGTFSLLFDLPLANLRTNDDLNVGDFNEDGKLDLLISASYGQRVFFGNGDGTLDPRETVYAINQVTSQNGTYVVDINDDGHLDIVDRQSSGDQVIAIRLGDGHGNFGEILSVDTVGFTMPNLRFGDIDNDGHTDIIVTPEGQGGNPSVPYTYAGIRDGLVDTISVDLNGDGNKEVLAVNENNDRVKLFVGDNLDGLTRQSDLLTDRAPQAVTTADLNNDGQLEIITANKAGYSLTVFTGSIAAGYTSTDFDNGHGLIDMEAADLNNDGTVDLVALDDFANSLWIYSGNGTTTLDAPTAIPLGDTPSRITLADVNSDGKVDVVVVLPNSNRLMILSGNGALGFEAPVYVDVASSPSDVQVTDLNADGNMDLAVTLPKLNVLSVLYGRGGNQYARAQQIAVGENPTRVTLADADEDGRMDLIVANRGDDTVSVIYNRFDPNEVYRYDSDAIDPDNDALTYAIVDGPGGLIINSTTGELLWAASPDQVGEHTVTISADDGRGGVGTQTFKIDVQPARENAQPLFATESNATIGANEAFTYQATALDNDNDAVRYRLVDGPEGATIDPTTGLVSWDGRNEALSMGMNRQWGNVIVPPDSSYQTSNLTIEGWFNQQLTTGSSILFFQQNQYGNAFSFMTINNNTLQLQMNFNGQSLTYNVSYQTIVGKWTHFAVVFDSVALMASIYADGKLVGQRALPLPPEFTGARELNVGRAFGTFPSSAIFDNFRMWNVARTQNEIQQGMARQYDNDPRVTLDFRFDGNDSRTVRDLSIYGNDGLKQVGNFYPIPVPGLTDSGSYPFTIAVEDGRGGYDEQTFTVNVLPELRTSLSGHIFADTNGNSTQDTGEQSLAGKQVFIDTNGNGFADPSELQTTTDASGNYSFGNLLPGSYPVRLAPTAGYLNPGTVAVSVQLNQTNRHDVALGQLALGQIRGQMKTAAGDPLAYWNVFADLDGNGAFDAGEPSSITDANGDYAIAGLTAGDYSIRPELEPGWTTTGASQLDLTLAVDQVLSGNDFTLSATNTSVTGGVHFVTTPNTAVEARQTFRYAAIAMGLFEESITYDLSLAPDGMTVDPASGLVAWRPTIAQVGEHLIVLRATSASGSIALQDFYLQVGQPNVSPVWIGVGTTPTLAVSTTPPPAYVGLTYAVDLVAQDADGHAITYSLLTGPTGATLDANTGALRWLPALGDVGLTMFTFALTDELGASTTVELLVNVLNTSPATTPFEIAAPRTQVGLGQDYLAQLRGNDAIGRPLTWTLSTGPIGLTVSTTGLMQWTPGNADLGDQTVSLVATGVDGATQAFDFAITVLGRPVNSAPQIDSTPLASGVIGQEYQYNIVASDADNDSLVYVLVDGPIGMSIHPTVGTLRWTPAADQRGDFDVTVQVTDPDGETATQQFKVKATRFGGPPVITSIAPSEASIGAGYLYTVVARDNEGDPLTYRLLAAPAGMSIVETTGEISWTPTAGQLGLQDVVIEVSDGIGGAATQAFVIRVSSGVPNLPPQVTSTAPRFGAVNSAYSYTFQAVDPEATTLTYSLGQAPAGMTIGSSTGQVAWTPIAGQAGKHVVTLIATDAGGAKAIESFELDVLAANTAPVIVSSPNTTTTVGALFTYQVLVTDVDLDPISFELLVAPTGATIDAFGKISWKPVASDVGDHSFTVRASDPRGGLITQTFTLSVVADTVAPIVSLIERPSDAHGNHHPWYGDLFKVYAKAIDNVEVASLTLSANGQDIPLDANGTAIFPFEVWGFATIVATATATDTSGNVTTKTISFNYDVPEGWFGSTNAGAPTAEITSPVDAGTAYGMVSITGTADASNFGAYKLSYRRVDETSYTEILRSATQVVNGELGVWDTTLLMNDEYVIRLEVADATGAANIVEHHVGLSGNLKLGNFQLSFTDMVIPVAGIPIEITRIYDTLQADREGDFGYGWRLEYRNTDLRVGVPKTGLENIGIYSPLKAGVKVYLNLPGQGRVGFTFTPDIRVLPGWGDNLVVARPRFTPDPGVTATLSAGTSGYLFVNEYGELYATGEVPYNPASPSFGGAFVVTTKEGVTYRIDGATGLLESATDRDANTIYFSDNGVSAANGAISIAIERDVVGRIVRIQNAIGQSVNYTYSNLGDLRAVRDTSGTLTTFAYSSSISHYVENVIDPLMRDLVRTDYDSDGRLIAFYDSAGNAATLDANSSTQSVTFTDPAGYSTTTYFDEFGNAILFRDQLGNASRASYDVAGNLTSETDALGNTTKYTYNSFGDLITVTDANGNKSLTFYNKLGDVVSEIDAAGNAVRFAVDANGNITSIESENFASGATYAANGSLSSLSGLVQIAGITTDVFGNAVSSTKANGTSTTASFDSVGRLLTQTKSLGPVSQTIEYRYDAKGRLTEIIDPSGASQTATFDAAGRLSSKTDEIGNTTRYEYDERDLLIKQVLATSTASHEVAITFEYNSLGQLVAETDPLGRITKYQYDAKGRLIETVIPDLTPSDDSDNPRILQQYDAAGRLVWVSDRTRISQFEYNKLGQVIKEIRPDGAMILKEYDSVGRLTRTVSPGNDNFSQIIVVYEYTAEGALASMTLPDGRVVRSQGTNNGQSISSPDFLGTNTQTNLNADAQVESYVNELGATFSFEFTLDGRIARITDPLGNSTSYDYDINGRLAIETLPLGQSKRQVFDAAGNLVQVVHFDGTVEQLVYDSLGRVTQRQIGSEAPTEYLYDDANNLIAVTDVTGTTNFQYDAEDRLTRQFNADGTFVAYEYDIAGNRTRILTQNGSTDYEFDAAGRFTSITDHDGNRIEFEYNSAGLLENVYYPNGVAESYLYDVNLRLIAKTVEQSATQLEHLTYSYAETGLVNSVSRLDGSASYYSYDATGRLVSERQEQNGVRSLLIAFQYDGAGNRVLENRSTYTGGLLDGELRKVFTYDVNGRMTSIRIVDGNTTSTVSIEYDDNGNEISRQLNGVVSQYYRWNLEDQLIAVDINGDGIDEVTYEYDSFGNRVSRTENGQKVRYLVDSNRAFAEVIEELEASGNLIASTTFGAYAVSRIDSGAVEFLHTDAIGTVQFISSSGGLVTDRFRFDANGSLLEHVGTSENAYLFAGQRRDETTGLDFLRARNLDTSFGRFVSRDTYLTNSRTDILNRYVYANNNPLSFTDPSGYFSLAETTESLSIAGTIAKNTQSFIRSLKRTKTSAEIVAQLVFFAEAAYIYSQINSYLANPWFGQVGLANPEFQVETKLDLWVKHLKFSINPLSLRRSSNPSDSPGLESELGIGLGKLSKDFGELAGEIGIKFKGLKIVGGGFAFTKPLVELPNLGDGQPLNGFLLTVEFKAGLEFDSSKLGSPDSYKAGDLTIGVNIKALSTLEYKLTLLSLAEIANGLNKNPPKFNDPPKWP